MSCYVIYRSKVYFVHDYSNRPAGPSIISFPRASHEISSSLAQWMCLFYEITTFFRDFPQLKKTTYGVDVNGHYNSDHCNLTRQSTRDFRKLHDFICVARISH